MDMVLIAKEYVDSQKRAANNFFDAVKLFENFTDNQSQCWIDLMNVNEQMKNAVDEWRANYKKGREDSINMVNDGFNSMAKFLDEWRHQRKKSQSQE